MKTRRPHLQSVWVLMLTLGLLVVPATPSATAMPVAQVGAVDEAGLEVHIAFPNDQLQATWVVRVKRTLHDKVLFDYAKTMKLACQSHGNVLIKEESAIFRAADQSYISCDLPSLRETVYAMTKDEPGGPIQLSQECDCKNAWIAGQVRLEKPTISGTPTVYDNPLFYHPNFQYYVPQERGAADPTLHVHYTSVTQPFSGSFTPAEWNVIWTGIDGAEFLDTLGTWGDYLRKHELSTLKDAAHWANGDALLPADEPSEFDLTTDATTIYIGHSPLSGTYSDVAVKNLDWDPPCFGSGGG